MDYSNIILEMLDRIKTLEQEVATLKESIKTEKRSSVVSESSYSVNDMRVQMPYTHESGKRDTTRYMFEGNVYLKNRLVLAIVKAYVVQNKSITRQQLKQVFDKSLQGSIGVVENSEIASRRMDYEVRFFTKEDDVLHLIDGNMFVCNQWGILNIPNFIKRANQLGFEIEIINETKGEKTMRKFDPELTIVITNQLCNYDWYEDRLRPNKGVVGRDRKNGYLTRDTEGNNIGIVFMSDDARAVRYGSAEIMFFSEYESQYGRWRLINIGRRLPFSELEQILQEKETYTLTTHSRTRNC